MTTDAWIDVLNQMVLDSDLPPVIWRWAHIVLGVALVLGTSALLAYSPRMRYAGVTGARDGGFTLIGKLGATLHLFCGALMLQAGMAAGADERPRLFFILMGLGAICIQIRSIHYALHRRRVPD